MTQFVVRPALAGDAHAMAESFAAVAEERDGIATEPPVDIEERAALFASSIGGSVVAVADGRIVGMLHVEVSRHGFGEFGMLVDRDWRGRGVGSALVQAAIGWARGQGLHKLCLEVFAHNTAAIALYRKSGFVEEGRRVKQYRRASGELWDSIIMGLALQQNPVILAGMEITGLGWCGTRTGRGSELAHFYEHVLGLRPVHAEADFWVFELPDGRHVEIFGNGYPGKEHFSTGPVVGFAVRDLPAAVDELRRAGVELLGEPGPTWQHFRGPDGNVYELVTS